MNYDTIIGIEVHAQLLTESKIFCGCSTRFGEEPNKNTCPVCMGFPGVLPVLNKRVVEFANRAGVPLLEIVSEPDMRSAEEAAHYLKRLRTILQYLEICDGNMEEGSFRCDANISVRPEGSASLGTKTELKNMNSFKAVEKALQYEIRRQTQTLSEGGRLAQETRLWDAEHEVTRSMRSKEYAHDYRYFPDPDLLPLAIDEQWIEKIRSSLPELPEERKKR